MEKSPASGQPAAGAPRSIPLLATLLATATLLAGCGSALNSGSGALTIEARAHTLHTGEHLRLAAIDPATGEPVPVRWRITSSDNAAALGPGNISLEGLYSPPGTLSRDTVRITITATPEARDAFPYGTASAPTVTAPATTSVSTVISVRPGFVQPLQPENATLAAGASIEVRAQIAQVNGGAVTWTLDEPSTHGAGQPANQLSPGTLSGERCDHGPRKFTTCTVTYTAPAALAPGLPAISLLASTQATAQSPAVSARSRLMLGAITSNPALHQAAQTGSLVLGGSGSNDNDFDTYKDSAGTRYVADCCGGTLGALVEDQSGAPYILSNNHVLAESDQAHPGDTIEQPGLIDDACVPLTEPGAQVQPIGTLRYAVPLNSRSTNVDAALASVAPGRVNSRGAILELGLDNADAGADPTRSLTMKARADFSTAEGTLHDAPPTAGAGETLDATRLNGLQVIKSGRTTGLTCSTVDAVDLRVAVDYYKDCAETQPYTTKLFTGQIGIGGEAFADSGDSGALVLDAENSRAIGLLYATGTSAATSPDDVPAGLSLANPIGDVLSELGTQSGSTLTLVGASAPHRAACLDYDRGAQATRPALSTLSPDERTRVAAAVDAAATLRASPAVLAVSAGSSADAPGEGAVYVFLNAALPPASLSSPAAVPGTIAGVRTVIIPTDLDTIARGPAAWPTPAAQPGLRLSPSTFATARATAERLAPQLMESAAIFGVGVAQSLDSLDEPALILLVDTDASRLDTARVLQSATNTPPDDPTAFPPTLGGLRVRYLAMHRFRVTRSKYLSPTTASSCSLQAVRIR